VQRRRIIGNCRRSAAGSLYRAAMVDARERFVDSGPLRIWTERAGILGFRLS
jgi:hypothetical protein